jgi:hypothetical protein
MTLVLTSVAVVVIAAFFIVTLVQRATIKRQERELMCERSLIDNCGIALQQASHTIDVMVEDHHMLINQRRRLSADNLALTAQNRNLERSVVLLSNELDNINVDYAKQVLAATLLETQQPLLPRHRDGETQQQQPLLPRTPWDGE